ncbi:Beta-barrel assembly machine subunit BamD [Maribacter sedimenticola]|uniref:Beta-barrel assembly machine subunit BamD n=1 Tax=Maribacter sedimenticola TaxID=228956 RepID=A0ABY1SG29_9FLAO|nr:MULTISPECIES: outer membrane protein assembly factor BamD [Maribacter]TVZ14457.1 outer membrane protein assembly factor BamD [Maribacter sp. MAR_2009_72]SNR44086.1 Beta-barrel assembly machine subunit BamD [Maribacter sedimenticola]
MRRLFPILLITIALQSCNEYQKVLKNDDVKAKYDMAEKFYAEGDFKRANRLYEQIAPKYVGKPQGERVMFFLSNSYFERGDYNMAGYQFERFVKSYPKSDKVVEASFLGAKSFYELSPEYSLDQSDTDKALLKLQNFINTYPDSEFFAEANNMAKELTVKKERKSFEIVKQYNKLGEFNLDMLKSAVTASDNFVSDNPGSVYREDAMFIKMDALTHMAMNSFESLKEERLNEAKAAYLALKKKYPESKYDKKATNLLEKIDKELQRFQDQGVESK